MEPTTAPWMARPRTIPLTGVDIIPARCLIDVLNGWATAVGWTLGFATVNAIVGIV